MIKNYEIYSSLHSFLKSLTKNWLSFLMLLFLKNVMISSVFIDALLCFYIPFLKLFRNRMEDIHTHTQTNTH